MSFYRTLPLPEKVLDFVYAALMHRASNGSDGSLLVRDHGMVQVRHPDDWHQALLLKVAGRTFKLTMEEVP